MTLVAKKNNPKSQGLTDPARKLAALQSAGFKPTLYTLQAGNSATCSSQQEEEQEEEEGQAAAARARFVF